MTKEPLKFSSVDEIFEWLEKRTEEIVREEISNHPEWDKKQQIACLRSFFRAMGFAVEE